MKAVNILATTWFSSVELTYTSAAAVATSAIGSFIEKGM